MKKLLFAIILSFLFVPLFVNAATLIDNLEVEASAKTYTFSMAQNSWKYTLYTNKDTANIKVTPKSGVTVTGAGEVSVNPGSNTIKITATDGTTTEEYTLNLIVNKISDNEIENPNTGLAYPIAFGALLIVGVVLFVVSKKKKIYNI